MVKQKATDPSEDKVLEAFAAYVAGQWKTLARPRFFKPAGKKVASKKFYSLADAANSYTFKDKSLEETKTLVEDFSQRLAFVLQGKIGESHKLHHICLEILEWGGLQGASSAWLRHRCEDGNLTQRILDAKLELSGSESPKDLDTASSFHKKQVEPIPMNSGTTKIFALSDPENIAIYDGRVGAGLASLSIDFLRSEAGKQFRIIDPINVVPPALGWRWGEGRTTANTEGRRVPNSGKFHFRALSSANSMAHAQEAWRASRLFKMVIHALANRKIQIGLPDIERAFFMIGYDLGKSK